MPAPNFFKKVKSFKSVLKKNLEKMGKNLKISPCLQKEIYLFNVFQLQIHFSFS